MKKFNVGDIVYWKSDGMPGKVTEVTAKYFNVMWSGLKKYEGDPRDIKWVGDGGGGGQWTTYGYNWLDATMRYFSENVFKPRKTILIRRK